MTQVESIWQFFALSITNANDQWYGWLLVYLTKQCFRVKQNQSRKDPFKFNAIRTITRLRNKVPDEESESMSDVFSSFNKILFLTLSDFVEDSFQALITADNNNNIQNKNVVILSSDGPLDEDFMNAMSYMESFQENNDIFELRCQIIYYQPQNRDKWNGKVFSRHGKNHS